MGTSYLPIAGAPVTNALTDGWMAAPNRQRYVSPLSRVLVNALEPSTWYEVRVILDRIAAASSGGSIASKTITKLSVRTNAKGELWPY